MFELDDVNWDVACAMKVAIIGNDNVLLNKRISELGVTVLTDCLTEPSSWSETDICFLVADNTTENVLDYLQDVIRITKQEDIITIPIFITEENTLTTTDAIVVLKPHCFKSTAELYDYIYESISSIQSIVAQPGFVSLDLKDIQSMFDSAGRLIFSYCDYKVGTDKNIAIKTVMQRLESMNFPLGFGKFIILNITGREEHLSMYEICEISELITDKLGTKECSMIWGANINNVMDDKIRMSLWLKY